MALHYVTVCTLCGCKKCDWKSLLTDSLNYINSLLAENVVNEITPKYFDFKV